MALLAAVPSCCTQFFNHVFRTDLLHVSKFDHAGKMFVLGVLGPPLLLNVAGVVFTRQI